MRRTVRRGYPRLLRELRGSPSIVSLWSLESHATASIPDLAGVNHASTVGSPTYWHVLSLGG
jgi:hypothetical protein